MIDLGSILLFLALLLLVVVFVSRPLVEHRSVSVSEDEMAYSALLAERDRILAAIQELDFDQIMGKIPAEDYNVQRAELLRQGAEVLRRLDELQAVDPGQGQDVDARLEAAIAARRENAVQTSKGMPVAAAAGFNDDVLENLISARRQAREGKATGFCHQCGHPIQQSDRFCSKCGATT